MPRTAILLCVHNAATLLPWWISHHIAVGFSALLICDDHSTDGSRDILSQAARIYDIRLLETDIELQDLLQRRRDALERMIQQEGHHFDWLIHLAVDEYFIPSAGSVEAFFAQQQAAHSIKSFQHLPSLPIHWCITGLNGRDQIAPGQPAAHPRAIFTHHAPLHFPDHAITRSFFRPTEGEYTLPDPFAHTEQTPSWTHARILHDAAASSPTPQARRYYNRNDVPFLNGQDFLPHSLEISARILQSLFLAACYALQNSKDEILEAYNTPSTIPPHFTAYYLIKNKTYLTLDQKKCTISLNYLSDIKHNPDVIPLILFTEETSTSKTTSHNAWLCAASPIETSYLPAFPRTGTDFVDLLDCLPLSLHHHDDSVDLRHIISGKPLLHGDNPDVTLLEAPISGTLERTYLALQTFTAYGYNAAGLKRAIQQSSWLAPSIIGALYAHLPKDEARTLFSPLLYRLFHQARS